MQPDPVLKAAQRVRRAIKDEGRLPALHRKIMRKHRRDWPVLWGALNELIRALEEQERGDSDITQADSESDA